jgi:hypothetical protein
VNRRLVLALTLCLLAGALPAEAQEEPPQPDPNEVLRDALDAPVPIADHSVPEWWNRTTRDWRIEPAIWQAYEEFWDARADALYELNAGLLEPRMAGPALERERAGIESLRGQGQAQVIDIDHRAEMIEAVADEGVIYDPYRNRTYRIDATTKQRVEPEFEPETVNIAYLLQPIDGAWKVVDAIRLVDEAQ